jgi:phytoene desaturase
MSKVAVIGAGFGGLSASIRLASAGYSVDLFEKQSFAGGKAGSLEIGGYRFDTGPSLFTMVHVFRDLFEAAGASFDERVAIKLLNPLCTYFYPDRTVLTSYSDSEQFVDEVYTVLGEPEENMVRFLDYSKSIYDAAAWLFLEHNLRNFRTYFNRRAIKSVMNLYKIDPFRTLDEANNSFFSDPKLVQLFDRYATYNGSSPYKAPATFNLIPHVEYGLGGFGVEGGIYAISQALYELAEEKGVRVYLSTEVDSIIVEKGKVRGIVAAGERREYDAVVSNADVIYTYDHLLEEPDAFWRKRYAGLEPSSSGLVFYWGMDRSFPELGLHNIFFSSDYKKEFNQIFELGEVPDGPTIYINITSKITPGDSPPGGENWFILLNVPYDRGHDWPKEAKKARSAVLRRLENQLDGGVEKHIAVEQVMTPLEIEKNTNSTYGSLYGISSNDVLAAFRRHPNRVKKPRGLYFCGGSSHPGGGMPLAILSGKIAADEVTIHHKYGL